MYKKFSKPAVIIITTIILSVTIFAIASASHARTMEDLFIEVVRKSGEIPFERNTTEIATEIKERLGCQNVHLSTERVYALYEDRVMVYKFETDFNTLEGDWWPTLYWANESFMTIEVTMDDGTVIQIDANWEAVYL